MTGSRYATFIDAGHLRSVLAQAVAGVPSSRARVEFDPTALDYALRTAAAEACAHSTLSRHYFYDASSSKHPAPSHDLIARHGNFVLRLGKLKENGQQKGVDTRLALDMALKTSDREIDDVILLGADYDLLPGFEEAKERGARVHLIDLRALGAAPCRELYVAADSIVRWTLSDIMGCANVALMGAPQADSQRARVEARADEEACLAI